jgi:hypothetical protein
MATPNLNRSEFIPLLISADIERPLGVGELVIAAAILTTAHQEPDDIALEAVGYYARKEKLRAIGSVTFGSNGLTDHVEDLLDRLPKEISESDLLPRLKTDLFSARRGVQSDSNNHTNTISSKEKLSRRKRAEALREKAGVQGMLDLTDLEIGDDMTLTSVLFPVQGAASSKLQGQIIGIEESKIGTVLLFKVKKEKRSGNVPFKYLPYNKGAVVRILGTVLWGNGYRKHPSQIVQGECLEFLDKDGSASTHDDVERELTDSLSSWTDDLRLPLIQINLNGTDIFTSKE